MSAADVSLLDTAHAARVMDAVKVYGSGETEVRALDGVSVGFPAGPFYDGRSRPSCGRPVPASPR